MALHMTVVVKRAYKSLEFVRLTSVQPKSDWYLAAVSHTVSANTSVLWYLLLLHIGGLQVAGELVVERFGV